ncbi:MULTISPECIES: leishmanolysin-related zinc metalloendopeptidase [Streptomyces]|uniref:Peptidase n=1 Tax=Streptomyces griseocarneus TaxID=51201 RepID=A0ABX7RQA2_9ACTN|nr:MULTISPECIES: leishmanolysin-related zinc metalloendopeptidase [Streptomyces]QSY49405.1 peptidase [Streptomyces griseocarneus]
MAEYETYYARADEARARELASTTSPYTIEVEFLGGLNQAQKAAFTTAADRWAKVIVGDLPDVSVNGRVIDDLLIRAEGTTIDGPGIILGQAGPGLLRPANGPGEFLPATGIMSFDKDDLASMQAKGTLVDVITHEMGHVIGLITSPALKKGLVQGVGGDNPVFRGQNAQEEYRKLRGADLPKPVPVENEGQPGTRDAHWREKLFANELMTGFVKEAPNPLSRLTVAAMKDLGYVVDLEAADDYSLPSLLDLAEEGTLRTHIAPIEVGIVLPTIPTVLPSDSLVTAA